MALEETWKVDAGVKRHPALSLFSGAGGMDLGVSWAGFIALAYIESDHWCCETLRANKAAWQHEPLVLETDIRDVEPIALMRRLGARPGELDLLYGGPPCQSFSQIGKQKGIEDERGLLLFEMLRFAEAFEPRAVLVEQVKGLLGSRDRSGQRGGILDTFLKAFERAGYRTEARILNALDYGIPQRRERLFIVAAKGSDGFRFPPATHQRPDQSEALPLLPAAPTARDALRGLGTPSLKSTGPRDDSHCDVTPPGDRRRIHGVPAGGHLAAQKHLPPEIRGGLTKKDTTKFLRLAWDLPANTLRCGEIFFHPTEDRYLTPREYLRLHGFPDAYRLVGPIRSRSGRVRDMDQHRQVANAVPPPLAEAIARQISETLTCQRRYLSCSASR